MDAAASVKLNGRLKRRHKERANTETQHPHTTQHERAEERHEYNQSSSRGEQITLSKKGNNSALVGNVRKLGLIIVRASQLLRS